MADETNLAASGLFATLFAGLMARTVSTACGAEWQIELTEPPPTSMPLIDEPVHYQLRFTRGLSGGCYLVLSEADAAAFGAPQKASEEVKAGAMLLALLQEVVAQLPRELAESHGEVLIEAALAEGLDPDLAHAIALRARGAAGKTAVLLLHFDAALASSLAARAVTSAGGAEELLKSAKANLDLVMDVELNCTLRFGQRQLSLREILDLASGSVVELDRQVDEPVELILDGKVIARGEAVIIDGNYGLRVTQVVQPILY